MPEAVGFSKLPAVFQVISLTVISEGLTIELLELIPEVPYWNVGLVALATLIPKAKAKELAISGLNADFVFFRLELAPPPQADFSFHSVSPRVVLLILFFNPTKAKLDSNINQE